jgi:hypothetical protein
LQGTSASAKRLGPGSRPGAWRKCEASIYFRAVPFQGNWAAMAKSRQSRVPLWSHDAQSGRPARMSGRGANRVQGGSGSACLTLPSSRATRKGSGDPTRRAHTSHMPGRRERQPQAQPRYPRYCRLSCVVTPHVLPAKMIPLFPSGQFRLQTYIAMERGAFSQPALHSALPLFSRPLVQDYFRNPRGRPRKRVLA